MVISNFKDLIKNLPFLQQSFEVKKTNWKLEKYSFSEKLNNFFETYFIENRLTLSRWDLFEFTRRDPFDAAFAIIMWGYPGGMRGDSFQMFLKNIDTIRYRVIPNREISVEQLLELLTQIPGIGLSTLTKFLYFFCNKLEGLNCLIFDRRIIATLNEGHFEELKSLTNITDRNKTSKYFLYLKQIHAQAVILGCKPDQLELFLFMFGDRLKTSEKYEYYTKVQQSLSLLNQFETELHASIRDLLSCKNSIVLKTTGNIISEALIRSIDDKNVKRMYDIMITVAKAKSQLSQTWY